MNKVNSHTPEHRAEKSGFAVNFFFDPQFALIRQVLDNSVNFLYPPRQIYFMHKGISPVIAIIMLLLITVSLIGLSYVWISSTFQATAEKTEKSIEKGTEIMSMDFEINSAWVDSNRNSLYISLQNTGTGEIKLSEVSVLVNGIDAGKSYADINPKGLVLYLPFDESSGNVAKDLSGNGNDGTLYVGAGDNPDNKWIDGMFGKALQFDGVDDYVDIIDTSSKIGINNELTVVIWVKPEDQPLGSYTYHNDIIASQCGGGNGLWRISTHTQFNTNELLRFQVGWIPGIDTWWGPPDAKAYKNQWNFLVLILNRNNGNAKFYQNGNFISSSTFSIGAKPLTNEVHIAWDCAGYFKGTIDEVRIYNRALSEEEILALYGKGDLKENKKAILKVSVPAQVSDPCGATVSVKYMGKEKTAQIVCV